MCAYQYYEDETEDYARLFCTLTSKQCICSRRCGKVRKYISIIDKEKECYIYNMEMKNNIPKGSYFVQTTRPNSKGNLYLYVLIEDKVQKIASELKELNQNYVYLQEGLDGFEVSLTPFETVAKSTTQTKKTYAKKK